MTSLTGSLPVRFPPKDPAEMYYWHALPDGREHMPYGEFVVARRERMAQVIKHGHERLGGKASGASECTLKELVSTGETTSVEFTSRRCARTSTPASTTRVASTGSSRRSQAS